MNVTLRVVAVALALIASACSGRENPAGPSPSSSPVVITSTPPAGVTPQLGQRFEISVSGPSATGVGMTALTGFTFVRRDDGVQFIAGCTGANGGISGVVYPDGRLAVLGKGRVMDLEILVAYDVPISDVAGKRCLFAPTPGDPYDIRRERAQIIILHPLGWTF